jgi:hypothetical protein
MCASMIRADSIRVVTTNGRSCVKGKRTILATFGFLLGEKKKRIKRKNGFSLLIIEKEYEFGFVSFKSLSFGGSQLDFKQISKIDKKLFFI